MADKDAERKKKEAIPPLVWGELAGAIALAAAAASIGWTTFQQWKRNEGLAAASAQLARWDAGNAAARTALSDIEGLCSDDLDYHLLLGAVHVMKGDALKGAGPAFDRALAIDPGNEWASLGKGVTILYRAGDPALEQTDREARIAQAISAFGDAAGNPETKVAALVNEAAARTFASPKDAAELGKALALYEDAEKEMDGHPVPLEVTLAFHYDRAITALLARKSHLAFRSLLIAREVSPYTYAPQAVKEVDANLHRMAREMLGDATTSPQESREAAERIAKMLDARIYTRQPRVLNRWGLDDPALRVTLLNLIGFAYYQAGEFQKAVNAFTTAQESSARNDVKLTPIEKRNIALNLGQARLQLGRQMELVDQKKGTFQASAVAFRKAFDIDATETDVSFVALCNAAAVSTFPEVHDYQGAVRMLETVLEKLPSVKGTEMEAETHRRIGVCWEMGNQGKRAKKHYEIAIALGHKEAFELQARADKFK